MGRNTRSAVAVNKGSFIIPGFLASATWAGIKKKGLKDLTLIFSERPATAAGVFTKNRIKAAPVILDKRRIKRGLCQAILINSGIANSCTGKKGLEDAILSARMVANGLKIPEKLVLVSSTGIIGQSLKIHLIKKAIPTLIKDLSRDGFLAAAQAITTTDTFPKISQRFGEIEGKKFSVLGIAKGAGMIMPHLATMLAFILTDAVIEPYALKNALQRAVDQSFHKITVDGDTSTNDMVLALANGLAGNKIIDKNSFRNLDRFEDTFTWVLADLAKMIVKDGEGATKFVTVRVCGARSKREAKGVGFTIANSTLTKTAWFGEDPNWGRIMAAIGRSGIPIDPYKIDISFDKVKVTKGGISTGTKYEKFAKKVLKKDSFTITINLNRGSSEETLFTCDLTPDYVKLNAAYRT